MKIHARAEAVEHLMAGTGWHSARNDLTDLFGIQVVTDESMPADTVDFRHDDRVVSRLLRAPDGQWYEVGLSMLTIT